MFKKILACNNVFEAFLTIVYPETISVFTLIFVENDLLKKKKKVSYSDSKTGQLLNLEVVT